jgi:diadenosine tetraphosphatase ApaH/serine/threonine PP2A family protein phosphatase
VEQRVVVCGHTHVQFDRTVDRIRLLNAGSVGMAYEGRRGAFWLALGPGVEFRRADYDCERAAEQILASGYWAADNLVSEIILHPPDGRETEAFFERLASERGER